jgi:hypothetical protein
VTVTGADDAQVDGNVAYTIVTAPAVSSDPNYNGLDAANVSVTNSDNDTAGIRVTPTSGLVTSEAGGTATFTVVLNTQPTANVTIGVSSSDTTEGTVSPATLTFTAANWNTPQTVTVTGQNDDLDDGDIAYTIVTAPAASTDANYNGLDAANVSVTNTDDDTAGITVTPIAGLVTTEAGGTATFTIKLTSEPTGDVTIGLSSSDASEGTVAPTSVTFTTANWSTPQTVTVTGQNDDRDDGDIGYTIVTAPAASSDGNYNGLNPADVSVTNQDNDTAGITVSPTSGLVTSEAGGTATFTVRLNTQPTANVTIALSSSDATEGTVSPTSVTFTTANWSTPQTVTVTGQNDAVDDGDIAYTIVTAAATTGDPNYSGLNAADVSVTNQDNDVAGITVTPIAGLVTTEAGGTATFTVVLNTQPAASVTIGLSSSDASEGTVAPTSLTFTAANWNTPQTVTITGQNDDIDDGDIAYTIVTAPATSADPNYNGLDAANVSVTNTDDDTAGITVSPTSGLVTSEAGGTATFTVRLNTQPTADVTIGISSSDASEGTVAPTSVTFTTANWSTPQTVTVTGQNDDIDDGDIAYTIVTAAAASTDSNYNGLNPADISVTNTDNDTAGITVNPVAGLVTTEAGGTATFTIKLTSEPTGDVTIGISSSDASEGTVAPTSVTFTTANWSTPQTVTVTGQNDDIDDGDIAYTIVTAPAASSDGNYNGLDAANVSVTNQDNDTAGITVSPTSGLVTSEAGGTATFTVRLNTQPTANVTIALSSSDATEGTVSPTSVTFTTANWNVAQTVTVTGLDDAQVDGSVAYTIVTAAATSADLNYSGLNPVDVSVTNTDNDTAGITVTPIAGLVTTEAGGTATFTVVLNTQPAASVTIGLSSSDASEGTVAPTSLTFTAANWNTPQTVTVTGQNDDLDDGDIAYTIVTAAAASTDGNYNGLNPADVSVTNSDNDTAGITVSPTSGLTTTEAGGTASFTVRLNTQPAANVTIGLSSSDATEGTVSPTSVTFTTANWSTPQTVTVTGQNDDIDDGDIAYTIVTAAATSSDSNYSGLNPADVSVTNQDNDTAGITVTPTSGLVTTEAGGTATFTVVLNTQPTANVTIGISSSDTTEGTVSPATLTFTAANWNTPQTVTVTGQNDDLDDGDIAYTIVTAAAVSTDSKYNKLTVADVSVTNTDNNTAGITVNPVAGLVTTEAGGMATFTVVLNTQPAADVTIGISSSDTTEGTVSPATLTFTAANWNTPQTVTVTGQNDDLDDGDIAYTIVTAPAASTDANYNGLDAANVSVTNTDDDTAGITVTPIAGLVTTEAGGTATFTIKLTSEPTGDVTIGLSSSDASEGTVAPTSVTFTTANWSTPQTVTVTGQNDDLDDGDIGYTIVTAPATSADPNYNGLDAANVSVTNTDDDTAGITVNPVAGLVTTEAGGTATFTVRLNTQPTANVTIALSSSDATEGTVSPTSVTFTTANWSTPQTVTVTGQNDDLDDGNIAYTIVTAPAVSADSKYNNLAVADVSVTNTDDDTAGITVTPIAGLVTTEAGGTATFTVVLNTQPTADVTIGLSSSDLTEGTVAPASLTFTSANWNTPQTVTVTGADDAQADGSVAYTIVTAPATSADPNYNGLDAANVSVTNQDNDTAGITVSPTSGLVTSEAGGTASFTVVLNTQPTADVTIGLSSSDATEGTVAPASLTFTSANWNTPQTVTVTGADDAQADGSVAYTIVTAPATSADPNYNGLNPADVSVTNTDNDTAGITVTPTSGLVTTEAGGTASFTVVLNTQPAADVTIGISSSDTTEGTVSPVTLTFTAANWSTPQTVTVRGVDDAQVDGNVAYTIITAPAVSTDSKYNNLAVADVSVTNTDDDTAGITVTPIAGLVTTEAGGTATFTIVLNTQPAANVTIALSSSDASEGTVAPTSLTFTAANWNAPQTVTGTGQNDDVDDGDIGYTIVTAAAVSGDPNYSGLNAADVSVTNTDNDTAGITVTPTSGLVTSEAGGTATFTVVLNTQPAADVTIGLNSSDLTEGTVAPTSLTFTAANWNTPQTVSVTGQNDDIDDGDIGYTIVTAAAVSGDPNYSGLNAADVSVTNTDDDLMPTVTLAVAPASIAEAGGAATFTATLSAASGLPVTVDLGFSGTATLADDYTRSGTQIVIPAGSLTGTITVTAVQDSLDEADETVIVDITTVTNGAASGTQQQTITIMDDDGPLGLVVYPTSVSVPEGSTSVFTVRLSAQPASDVTVTVERTSGDSDLAITGGAGLKFTSANWSTTQTVTLAAFEDADAGNGTAVFTVSSAGLSSVDVAATEADNDVVRVVVSSTSVSVPEGNTSIFTVQLSAQPASDVTVTVDRTSGDSDLTASGGAVLTFTPNKWNTPQAVALAAAEDADALNSTAVFTVASAGLSSVDVTATEVDNETLGLVVSPTSTSVSEGSTTTFSVRLSAQPASDVTVSVGRTSGDSDLTVSGGALLTFTPNKWNIPQTVTLAAAEDADALNGTAVFTVSSAGLSSVDVTATEVDNDTLGLVVSPTSVSAPEGGTSTFTVRLSAQPASDVTVNIERTAGDSDLTASGGALLTFTSANWSSAQTVTLAAAEDVDVVDGTAVFTVSSAGLSSVDVTATEVDNDTLGLVVSPTNVPVAEGGTSTFAVRLSAQPASDVTVSVGRTSGDSDLTASGGALLTFTPANWSSAQTVTLAAGEDADVVNGTAVFTVSSAGLSSVDVTATEADNDTLGLLVSSTSVSAPEGGTSTFTVQLSAQPTSDVTVSVGRTSGDTDLTVSGGATLTFTFNKWNTPQTVTLAAAEDADAANGSAVFTVSSAGTSSVDVTATEVDNESLGLVVSPTSVSAPEGSTSTFTVRLSAQPASDVTVSVGRSSGDSDLTVSGGALLRFTPNKWNTPQTVTLAAAEDADAANGSAVFTVSSAALSSVDVTATEVDNDTLGLVVSSPSVSVAEGSTSTFTVRLSAQPASDVTVNVERTAGDSDLTASGGALLTFTSANWSSVQTVTLAAAEDVDVVNGTAVFRVSSAGLSSVDVTAAEADNDTLGLVVSPTNVSAPEGGTSAFTVRLSAQPASDVMVSVGRTSGDSDLTVSGGALLTFTSTNWNSAQTVTLAAAEDVDIVNGTAVFTVSSAGLSSVDVTAAEADNDTLGLLVSSTSVSAPEGGTSAFTVRLSAQPASDVTVSVGRTSGDTDLTVSGGVLLRFTPNKWNTPQTVTLAAAEDADAANGSAVFTVSSAETSSVDVTATEVDNESLGLVVSPTSVPAPEGSTSTFTVRLSAQPASDVTVSVGRSSGDSDLTVSGGAVLTFTPNKWNTPQTVTLAAAEDADAANGTAVFTVSSAGMSSVDVTATEADNDTLGLVVSPTSVSVPEGGTSAFTVRLSAQPTSDVTVSVERTAGDSDLTASGGALLTFTSANWSSAQTVTLAAAEDVDVVNGTAVFTVSSAGLSSLDVTATEADNDAPATKFYVVNDALQDQTYGYTAGGGLNGSYNLNAGNTAPRGIATTVAGDKIWVVDANRQVYVYNAAGGLLGSWTAGALAGNAVVEDIAVHGTDVWILDAKSQTVYRYSGAAGRLSGTQDADPPEYNLSLNKANKNPKGIVTDGTYLWVVDDATTDTVFKYQLSGLLLGNWTISTSGAARPAGVTIDPTNVSNIWVVDSGTKLVYQYTAAASRISGSQAAEATFALAAGNTNPQGIADPAGLSAPVATWPGDLSQIAAAADAALMGLLDVQVESGSAKDARAIASEAAAISAAEWPGPPANLVVPEPAPAARPRISPAVRRGSITLSVDHAIRILASTDLKTEAAVESLSGPRSSRETPGDVK